MAEQNRIPTPEDMMTAVGALGEMCYMLLTTYESAGFSHSDAMDVVKAVTVEVFSNSRKVNDQNGEAV